MTLNEYQQAASRTHQDRPDAMVNYALGVAGEAGEVVELVKKHWFHKRPLSREKFVAELGDVLWYVSQLAHVEGIPLEDVAAANVTKLRERYPEGFK
jgi:NTP pyrophosphatase (non-canonical NTP hydrolase)